MDAPVRRRTAAFGLGLCLPLLTGCALFDRDTDRKVQSELHRRDDLPSADRPPPVPAFDTQQVPRGQMPPGQPGQPGQGPIIPGSVPTGPLPAGPLPPVSIPGHATVSGTTPPTPPPPPPPTGPAPALPGAELPVPSSLPPAPPTSRVKMVATIGTEYFVTDEEVSMAVRQRAREYVTLTGTERTAKEKEVYRDELKKLIERELIVAEFVGKVKKNKPEVLDEIWADAGKMADRQLRELRRVNDLTSEEKFTEALQAMGLDLKSYKRNIERAMVTQMYLRELLKDKGKTISLAEIEGYYRRHPAEFKVDDRAVWQHLFVSYAGSPSPAAAKQKAEQLLKAVQGGADVKKLAAEHGHGDSALRNGEGNGTKRGEILPRELEPTVFSLKAGQVSGLVATATGYHIVKVTERDVAGVQPFDAKVQSEVRNKLTDQLLKQERDRVVEDLWRRSAVTIEK